MKRSISLLGTIVIGAALVGCATAQSASTQATTAASQNATTQAISTPTALPTSAPTSEALANAQRSVSARGVVKPAQDANLSFRVQGTVEQVLVKEGDQVEQGQVLAVLDTRPFDQRVAQAQAAFDIAQSEQVALNEAPKAADVAAARAQVRQAEIALAQAQVANSEDARSVQAALDAAQAGLQSQRDQLSRMKTQAEAAVETAALTLTQAQAAFAKANSDWEFVKETNQNPAQPDSVNPQTGKKTKNELEETGRQQYYATFVQAEAALRQAEQRVQQAQIDAEQAQKAEVTGIQAAEQQVTQASTTANKVRLPANINTVAAAQTSLDQAKANLARLNPAPTKSTTARTAASIRSAQAALDGATLDRENAELRAPFGGTIDLANVSPGDQSTGGNEAPFYLIDASNLYIDADVSDADIGRVSVGQTVQINAETMADKPLAGKVTNIAAAATVSGNVRTYRVRIALDEVQGLRSGMSVRVLIAGT